MSKKVAKVFRITLALLGAIAVSAGHADAACYICNWGVGCQNLVSGNGRTGCETRPDGGCNYSGNNCSAAGGEECEIEHCEDNEHFGSIVVTPNGSPRLQAQNRIPAQCRPGVSRPSQVSAFPASS